MNVSRNIEEDWEFIVGWPWEEARLALQEGGVNFQPPRLTAAPNKSGT